MGEEAEDELYRADMVEAEEMLEDLLDDELEDEDE